MRHLALMAMAATVALTALPASAQMRTSTPKPAATAAMTDTGIRPTNIGGTERAQVLPKGSLIWNVGSLGFQHGLMDNLELNFGAYWNPGLTLAPSVALTGGLNAGIGAKLLVMDSSAMSIAVDGRYNLGSAGGTVTSGLNLGLPISFWMGKSAFHVGPTIGIAGGSSNVGANLAYERELNNKWRFFLGDRLGIDTNGAVTNGLNGGVRVAFTPNLTVDVGVASGALDFNPTNIGAQATLLTFGATFGTKSIDELRGFFGL